MLPKSCLMLSGLKKRKQFGPTFLYLHMFSGLFEFWQGGRSNQVEKTNLKLLDTRSTSHHNADVVLSLSCSKDYLEPLGHDRC